MKNLNLTRKRIAIIFTIAVVAVGLASSIALTVPNSNRFALGSDVQQEFKDEITKDLTTLVEDGTITQAQLDEISAWIDNIPQVAFVRYTIADRASENGGNENNYVVIFDIDIDTIIDKLKPLNEFWQTLKKDYSELILTERLPVHVDGALAIDLITEAEATELKDWINEAPTAVDEIDDILREEDGIGDNLFEEKQGLGNGAGAFKFGNKFDWHDVDLIDNDEKVQNYLKLLVENGTITQAQADEVSDWLDAKPEVAFNEPDSDYKIIKEEWLDAIQKAAKEYRGTTQKLIAKVEIADGFDIITAKEATELKIWIKQAPAVVD